MTIGDDQPRASGAGGSGAGFGRQARAWERPQGLDAVLQAWAQPPQPLREVALDVALPAQPARFAPLPPGLDPGLVQALRGRGLDRLYTHQAEAFRRAQAGEDLVVATPTASGKSLAYNLPVLQALFEDREARALYLFPTKALSRDQESALAALMREAGLPQGVITFDGDTPGDARRAARERSHLLISNPDMLHAGILPQHARWARFFSKLRYVVIDELHMYRGVFGAHLANLLRRLLRVAAFHGAQPQLLFSSATIANPAEHASELAGRAVGLVGDSGAPAGERRVMVVNPPVLNPELGVRQSAVKLAVQLAAQLVQAGVSTLLFGSSRNQVEVMLKYLRDALASARLPAEAIQGYRGGYLPNTRRRIERGLREGQVRAVVATNALELGVDIGSLDAVVCVGYPGTQAALWQRFGRSGRRQGRSLSVLVTNSSPLNQYIALHAGGLLERPVEEARIDPDNVEILLQQLKCAAYELPFEDGEGFGRVPAAEVRAALDFLADHQVLRPVPGRSGRTVFHWAADAFPAQDVPLRSPSWDNFVIVDVDQARNIAEMDFRSAHTMLHEQAIYQHDGRQYQVERLDYDNHKAFIRRVKPDYYTTALTHTRVSVVAEEAACRLPPAGGRGAAGALGAGWGDVEVVEKVVGYKKIKFHTHENVGYGDVHLPAVEKVSVAFWITVPQPLIEAAQAPRSVAMDAWRGVLKAMHAVAAVGLMMDARDLAQAVVDEPGVGEAAPGAGGASRCFEPTLYLYESVPGGVGLAQRLYVEREALLSRAGALIRGCACAGGCPSCVGVTNAEQRRSQPDRKQVALRLLAAAGVDP